MAVFQPCARFWTCSAQLPWLCLALWSFTINVHNLVLSSCSAAQSCLTLCDAMDSSTPGSRVLHCLPEFAQTHVHWVGDAIRQSHPLMPLPLQPSIFPRIRVFPNESALHIRWANYWSFSINLSNEYSGLISFRIDWFYLSLHSKGLSRLFSSAIFQKHQFFGTQPSLWFNSLMVQLSYMTTGKIIALTRWTFVGKVMSLLFSTVSRFVVAFLSSSKHP